MIKLKLAVIYFLIIGALVTAGYVSYNGLTHLMTTLRAAVQPDERAQEFKDLLNFMHSGENNMRLYNITHINDYLIAHHQTNDHINTLLQNLIEECRDDSVISIDLDSISVFFQRKEYVQDQLIRLKRTTVEIPDVMEKVLTEVDSLENNINTQTDTVIYTADTTLSEKPKKKKGFFAWLFPSKKTDEPGITINKDTVTIPNDKPVEISEPIKKTLEEFNRKDKLLRQQLTARDLEFTRENDLLTGKITMIAERSTNYLSRLQAEKAESAGAFFVNTSKYIALAGTASAIILLIMIVVITRDIQVIIRTKKQVEKEKTRAESLARAKEEFLANMSHEIRTPLNSIIGFTRYLKNEKLTQDGGQSLDIISKSSAHLLNIINEILDFSKLEAGQMKLEKSPVYIPDIIQESISLFRSIASEKKLRIFTEIDESLYGIYILCDAYRIRQVLNNLFSNAVKFTHKGFIEIKAGLEEDNHLLLSVKDTGCGIEESALPGIFEKFSQADNSTTRRYGGTGLGLSIVKKIISLMDGDISVDSKLESGTTFTLTIPVEKTTASGENVEAVQQAVDLSGLLILIVDDDPYNLILLKKMFTDCMAEVISAGSGAEALEIIENNEIDLMLVDIHMPEMNGFELLGKAGKDIPAIAISAYVNEDITDKCMQAGFRYIHRKPIETNDIFTSVNEILNPDPEKAIETGKEDGSEILKAPLSPAGIPEEEAELKNKLLNIYYENLSSSMEIIHNCNIENDFEKIRYQAHKLTPSSRHMGYKDLVTVLKKIDELELTPQNKQEAKKLTREFITMATRIRENLYGFISG